MDFNIKIELVSVKRPRAIYEIKSIYLEDSSSNIIEIVKQV